MEGLSSLVLGIRISQDSFQRVVLPAVNLNCKVEDIRAEAVKQTGLSPDQILLVNGGVALEDCNTLNYYGIKPGVMIHVLRKREMSLKAAPKIMSDKEVQQLSYAFRTFASNSGYRSALTRLSRPETLENIIMAIPGLNQDPIAVSIIRDPELLVHMGDATTLRKVLEKHPVLAEAANYIAAAVQEEIVAARHARRTAGEAGSAAANISVFSPDGYSGEEMDSSQSSDSPTARSSSSSLGGITSSQLEAALAAVGSAHAGASTSGASSSRNSGQDRSGLITPEMFNSALQQAFQGIALPNFSSSPVTPRGGAPTLSGATENNTYALAERMSQQLQQMRELGLRDQMFNMQALQITNGDVQAAIELVMSSGNGGGNEDDDDDNFQQ